ncbi:1-aminocyclopropane-1-carboxylate deaminase/D-cysteine desulfhydrase [Thalassotalea agariperforans]
MKPISPVQQINHPIFTKHDLTVFVKRDDLIHPVISGNKWRKLKYNLFHAKSQGYQGVLSFGGAYSNHLHALAYAGYQQGLMTKAIVRGEPHYLANSTLSQASKWGMQCQFVDRKSYRLREDKDYLFTLQKNNPDYYIVPEGGSNPHALTGVGELINELAQQVSYESLLVPVGSGGTIAGLIAADNNQHQLLGIAVLKQADYLINHIKNLLPAEAKAYNNWQLLTQFHRGGYAKFSREDEQNIYQFNQATGITFEPVYSGKMILALLDLIAQGYFKAGSRIVLVHTGGLQGIKGLLEQNRLTANLWR